MRQPKVSERLGPLLEQGLVATCGIVDLEVLFSADTGSYSDILEERAGLPRLDMSETIFGRAIEIQRDLARTSQHRVPIPDLLVAATAEQYGVIVVHYDRDFERIATVTGQRHMWVVPQGTL